MSAFDPLQTLESAGTVGAMKFIAATLVVGSLGAAGCASRPAADEVEAMNSIEARVVLPKEADPLERYRRYYYRKGGKIFGLYVAGEKPGRQWIARREDAPGIFDGGCSVVNVSFDVRLSKIDAFCNGLA